MNKDKIDFEKFGGTVPPRPKSVDPYKRDGVISEQEYRSSHFNFDSSRFHWVNRDITQEPGYKKLSETFRKLFETKKVNMHRN